MNRAEGALYFLIGLATGAFVYKFLLNSSRETKKEEITLQIMDKKDETIQPTKITVKEEIKMVLVVRTDLKMGTGKIAAQCSHATLGVYMKLMKKKDPLQLAWLNKWIEYGQAKITLKTDGLNSLLELEKLAKEKGLPNKKIMDAGKTQIEAGSITVIAIGPAPKKTIDEVTGKLTLL